MHGYFSQFLELDFQLRIRATHTSHCTDLGGTLHNHIATTYGLTRNCTLNSCRYFHVVDGLVPDIMHDLLEGSLQLCTKLLLQYLILQEKKFSLQLLNERISCFSYGRADVKNKPSPITEKILTSSDNKLSQSGMWALALSVYLQHLLLYISTCTYNSLTDVVFRPHSTTPYR